MSASLDQVVAAVSNSTSLWEGAIQQLLKFCVETGKKAQEMNSELEAVKKELQVLKQASEASIASLNASLSACKAQQIRQEDHLGQLEWQLSELRQKDRDRTQELQEVVTKQDLDKIATQENQTRINQLEQLVHTVPVTYSFVEEYLPAAVGVPGDQQVSNGLRNQAAAEVYLGDQQVGLEPQLDSSAETLP